MSAKQFDQLIRYGGDFYPQQITRAKGSYVYDENGRAILDFTSGQMCATIGHNHPNVIKAIEECGKKMLHLFSDMIPTNVVELTHKLSDFLPQALTKKLFVNTGSESNEAALRIAKLYTQGYEVVALGGSWHGVTGASSYVSYASDRKGYGPATPGTYSIPEPNAYRCPIKHCKNQCDKTCMKVGFEQLDMQMRGAPAALIAEPILSAGGVIVPPPNYFKELKEACHERGMLLIFDEAQTAFGRIGHKTAAEALDVTPDIMALSKTLGGGIPLAATVTTEEIENTVHQRGFNFYTSHVSDPLPAAVGLAVLETLHSENLIERAKAIGDYLFKQLEELMEKYDVIGDIRGQGLLYGIELVKDRQSRLPNHELGVITTQRCLELGLSMNIKLRPERGSVWRIAPPLTVSKHEIDLAVEIFDQSLNESIAKLVTT